MKKLQVESTSEKISEQQSIKSEEEPVPAYYDPSPKEVAYYDPS